MSYSEAIRKSFIDSDMEDLKKIFDAYMKLIKQGDKQLKKAISSYNALSSDEKNWLEMGQFDVKRILNVLQSDFNNAIQYGEWRG